MGRFLNIEGKKFGRLTVESLAEKVKLGVVWNCTCECGNKITVLTANLQRGSTKSCGCIVKKHGMTKSTEFIIWTLMKSRCNNPNDKDFHRYGGRGIKVCDRWLTFNNFYEDMGKRPSSKYTLDRSDNNGNYEPSNCKWSTKKEQCRNRRSNTIITYKNETKTLTEWSEIQNINSGTLSDRIKAGWSIEKAMETKVQQHKKQTLN